MNKDTILSVYACSEDLTYPLGFWLSFMAEGH